MDKVCVIVQKIPMIFTLRRLQLAPLYSRRKTREGAPVGYIHRFLFDSATAKLQKVICRSGFFRRTSQTVDADFLEIVRGRVYISSESAEKPLEKPSDCKSDGLQELIGLPVYTRSGVFVGRIVDLYLDDTSLQVIQLEVVKRMVFLPVVRLLITRQDVLEILPDRVQVRDAVLTEEDLISLFLKKGYWRRLRAHARCVRKVS